MAGSLKLDRQEATPSEKRTLCQDVIKGGSSIPDGKRPRFTLFSVVMEAMKVDSLQKLLPDLETLLRKVVKEELDFALTNFGPARVDTPVFPRRIQGPNERILQLKFKNKLSQTLFTGSKVEAEDGPMIHVQLLDVNTSQVVSEGPGANAKLEIVVLDGDFAAEDEGNYWEQSDFEHHTVKERDGKRPLLTGELFVTLKEGEGCLGDFQFTDNSSWIRSRRFRLGVKAVAGCCEGIRIQEAKTDPFIVKDHRGELYKKHYPPALDDEVWRLDRIAKDGACHKRLSQVNINTIEQFLRFHTMQPTKLRQVLGNGMSLKMWEGTVEHAQTCRFGSKQHAYQPHNGPSIIFNNIFQLVAIKDQTGLRAADSLNLKEKALVDKHVKVAYENWQDLIRECDGERLGVNPLLQGNSRVMGANIYIQNQAQNVTQSYATQATQPLPDQHRYIMEFGSSPNNLPLPPKASGAITLHPEGTEWQPGHPWQDLSRWSSFQSLAAEGARRQAQEMELDMMDPGNMAYIDNLAGCSTWQHNSTYEVKATSPSFLGEVSPHVNDGWQKIMAPTPAWSTFKHMRAGVRQLQQLEENNDN
ncbi:hypothetical protein BDL97_03G011000 [Sphagnum fallax]|uniref:Calmodulin-binding protein n=1 Tax=Sphagnum jensenii TaxID=128206 RepID=A0ABP0WVX2_9BRYO|nr:hypothetical protein BDL97_03G011000 [Sphagnum fallax]KAH8966181.1 hypothetical protein BDL97_03G011000 [Sphagnum fallax]